MDLYVRSLQPEDYEDILVGWWSDWGWDAPSRDFLPEDGTGGLLVYDSESNEPICAGFVYSTNSKAAWVDWIISSKTYRKKPRRKEALELLIETLTLVSKNLGCKYVYALIKHSGLINTYENLGYIQGDSYTSEMIKIL